MRIPNSEPIGFQSLGPGSGDTNMHAPKNRNNPGTCWSRAGTLLERPGTVPRPCWDLAGILLQPSWNLPVGTGIFLEPLWNLPGTLLELLCFRFGYGVYVWFWARRQVLELYVLWCFMCFFVLLFALFQWFFLCLMCWAATGNGGGRART